MKIAKASFLLGACSALSIMALVAMAQTPMEPMSSHTHSTAMGKAPPPALDISTTHSFAELMDNSDARMHFSMVNAMRSGEPDHDFASEMIPHHQGAVDMARIELLYGKDPVLRRVAQEIIVTQEQEIAVMQRRLDTINSATH